MLMRYLCYFLYIGNIRVGIAESLYIQKLCIILNGIFKIAYIVGVYKGSCNAVIGKRMLKKIIRAAVDSV